MNIIKTGLAASTAVGLSMAAAHANDNNTLYLQQKGDNNVASIQQDIPGWSGDLGGNDFGSPTQPAFQHGDNNTMIFSNGDANPQNAGNEDNDVGIARQIGHDHVMKIEATGGSTHGIVRKARQRNGNSNRMLIIQHNVDHADVQQAFQSGSDNTLKISQEKSSGFFAGNGVDNTVKNALQIGNGNGKLNGFGNVQSYGMDIRQRGGNLMVQEARITGDNNTHGIKIAQYGADNGQALSEAIIEGSNDNRIDIYQNGTGNNFGVYQGSAANPATGGNQASLDQVGNGNFATATQMGDSNLLTASFTGDGNGVGGMTGVAAALLAEPGSPAELFQGNIFQDSTGEATGNTISYNVTGSNNLFAFAQIGAANTITGNVGTLGASSGNQVAVLQTGSGNNSTFTQNGGGNNNLAINQ